MTARSHTLGVRLAAASPDERFALHEEQGDRQAFAHYDLVLAGLSPLVDARSIAYASAPDPGTQRAAGV